MHDTTTLVLTIIGALLTWTITMVSLASWLSGKFRDLERLVYREMDKHRREDDRQFHRHGVKIQRLELKTFGFTGNGGEEPNPLIEEPN